MSVDIKWQVPKAQPEASELAVVYARYSSHSQGEQSIEGQLSNARDYAAAHGYTIVHEYVDRAKSGRTDNRAEFQQMLKDTAKRQFSVIILWKVDRFGRNREEIAINKMKCRKNGVRVEYVAETIPDSPEGVILESVLEGFAEYYSLQLSQNIRRGRAESAEKCQSLGGNRPLGYKTGPDKKFVIDENTAPTVKMIFTMYADGKTVTEIVDKLNELGLRTLRGGPFTKNSLHSILKNKKYIGIYEYQGREIKDGVPRIIEDDVFNKVQEVEMLKEQSEKYRELETATQGVRGIAVYPNTPQAIAKYFETVYPDRIVFTERAYRSMDECTTKSDVLWEAFYHIAVDLYNLLKRNPATAFTDFKDYTGWDCSRGEGAQTHADSKFMRQRIDKYNGQEIDIEPHVKNGSQESDPKFVRIHFAYDPNVADKIIVGHCGKHLDNYSTRKARK